MITELTPQQEAMLPVYKEKWENIGMCTDPIDREKAIAAVKFAYECAGKTPPEVFHFARSPLECCKMQSEIKKDKSPLMTQKYGCHEAAVLAYYDFFMNETEVTGLEPIQGLIEVAKNCGWWAAYEDMAFIQERPCVMELNSETGPSIAYADGFEIHMLNNVRVPKWVVMTPPEEIDPEKVLKENNAQVRAELVRKVGIERLIFKLNPSILDEQGDYELLDLSELFGRPAPYLKMKNPSVPELWHVEGVGSECTNVAEALHFRKPVDMQEIPVSEDGEDWLQQGDVYLWPKEAKSLKPFPKKLT